MTTAHLGLAGRVAKAFIDSKLTPLLIVASLVLGVGSVFLLPREEEPQIVVPMLDIFVSMPGASAKEVEERVTKPMEKLLWEIPGVEYIYSTSSPERSFVVVRFKVGEDEEKSIVRLNQKMFANFDLIPPGASPPLIKPRSIDDVPILAVTLWSDELDHFALRRLAAQLHDHVKQVPDVSEVHIIGGQRRQVRVLPDPARMAAHGVAAEILLARLGQANQSLASGRLVSNNQEILVETGDFLRSGEDVAAVVVAVHEGRPVFVRDVAEVVDGPEEPSDYVFFGTGLAFGEKASSGLYPAVTLSVAKRKGTNAIHVAHAVLRKIESLKGRLIPDNVQLTVTRDYGETAREKSDELLWHMTIAVISVTLLILLTLGVRESGIVAIAIPVTLALTLAVFYLAGYTLNRVTLFALIFSIGILVDDAIVVVENVVRHYRMPHNRGRNPLEVAVEATAEVGNPTILATFTVIAAILPMAFVRGLMGPYMRPIPVGATGAMLFSLAVAFVVTPWASVRLIHTEAEAKHEAEGWTTRLYRRLMRPLIHHALWRNGFLAFVVLLLLGAMSLVAFKAVRVKMLPFDNKSELQVVIDMPEGSTLEQTAAATRHMAQVIAEAPETVHYQLYIGTAAPHNFNGLVRHYFLRRGPNVADIQVNLVPKGDRTAQSHDIAKRLRPAIQNVARIYGANVKIAEIPPGPPVLQTLVAEIYGPDEAGRLAVARQVKEIFEKTDGVVDVDWFVEDDQPKVILTADKEKAALHGIATRTIAETVKALVQGQGVGLVHLEEEKEDVPIWVQLPLAMRSRVEDLLVIKVQGADGRLVPLSELVQVREIVQEKSLYHKNLMPVVYVTGDVAGKEESPVYAILKMNKALDHLKVPEGYHLERYVASLPPTTERYAMKWDGEWHITYEVFRDLGIAFAAVLVLIYILVVGWFESFVTPLAIMAAIPFSLVGILPAHGLFGIFFTATSMIGFIAGAGIVVRNSIILVDFVELRLREGMPLEDAVVDAGAVRFRPMMLTAASLIVGASPMLLDPIFQGLALALMSGEVASLLLSRVAVPIVYFLIRRRTL
ncbi:efflux RND transporter permease subunit [Desulfosoma caldarium]|uniref:Multidrug efflux pump subunit AcrB n=1 Tax=Desulfosoma caldarium TaxID=610254 RepID=A0A3N1UIF4_9BACT|nr:efflux RND transporter permease subunit [Desulfosoma caldarium]ROQ91044.1 multidrug efflux pump subunit AcrB [Desulfosoma caldarium]